MYIRDILKRLPNQKSNIIFKVNIDQDINIVPVLTFILGIIITYFRFSIPKENDITERIKLLRENLFEKLSVKTENLLIDFYSNRFSLPNDKAQIEFQKKCQTKEYIKDGIRIIDLLKEADEIEQKAIRYSSKVIYSSNIVISILLAIIFVYFLSIASFWINIVALVCVSVILLFQSILVYYSRKNLEDLLDCEKRI